MIPRFCPPFWLPGYRPHLVQRGDFALLHLFAHGAETARHLQDVVGVQVSLLWYSDTPLAGEEVQPQSVWVLVVFISDVFPNDIIFFQTWVRRCPNGWRKRQTWKKKSSPCGCNLPGMGWNPGK